MIRKLLLWSLIASIIIPLGTLSSDAAVRISVSRGDTSFLNPSPITAFSIESVAALGGVALQSTATFEDANGHPIPTSSVRIDSFDRFQDRLVLKYRGERYEYPIEEDTFDRLFSWVENRGTGFYTAHSIDADIRKDGGFTSIDKDSSIASEFAASATIKAIAEILDFRRPTLLKRSSIEAKIMERRNRGVRPIKNPADFD